MTDLSRVVWSEGMHLAQHHFQAQSRYFEDSLGFALTHLLFKPHGLAKVALDDEALRNGTVAVLHARGVMPDGLPFNMPESDAIPQARDIRDLFSPTQGSHLMLLTIPPYRAQRANVGFDGVAPSDMRFIAQDVVRDDETTGAGQRSVTVGRKNFRLQLDAEVGEHAVRLPIARVRRDGMGSFMYDPDFIPACVHIAASERLLGMLHQLVEMLEAKSAALAGDQRPGRAASAASDPSGRDITTFWLRHTIHTSLTPLRHLLSTRQVHPEMLYRELARLGGALCTFALGSDPSALPRYDHDELQATFSALEKHLREHLNVVIPTGAVGIPLQSVAPWFSTGPVTDRRCVNRATWFLGVRSSAATADVIRHVPRVVKVCSAEGVKKIVQRAQPGLTIEHTPAPPAALGPRFDTQYFRLKTEGPCWVHIQQTLQVGVYAPNTVPDAEVELLVLVDEARG